MMAMTIATIGLRMKKFDIPEGTQLLRLVREALVNKYTARTAILAITPAFTASGLPAGLGLGVDAGRSAVGLGAPWGFGGS
jgi:hypothetical protein